MANETATLAGYVANLKFEDIPPEVLARAKVLTRIFSAVPSGRGAMRNPRLALKMLKRWRRRQGRGHRIRRQQDLDPGGRGAAQRRAGHS
jgi:hypothetical protein